MTIDWGNPPVNPEELGPEWEDTTPDPKRENTEDREYTNEDTGDVIEYHPADKLGRNRPHWHRHNPNRTGKRDAYLDREGNPVPKNSRPSHIYVTPPPSLPDLLRKLEDLLPAPPPPKYDPLWA